MGRAVHFDDELSEGRDEVDDVSIDRVLPTEFPPVQLAIAQCLPEPRLCAGLGVTQQLRPLSEAIHPPHPDRAG